MNRLLTACITALALGMPAVAADNASQEKDSEWQVLFDGTSKENFRNYRKDTISDGWKIVDGALVRAEDGAGDIITKDKYGAFELVLEYKISPGGNSGVMYHVTEEGGAPWHTGPEVQIQDNEHGHDPQEAGWLYQLYKADVDATKPAGQWNELRLVITPDKSVHYMNGVKYFEYDKGSEEWNRRVAKSKFSKYENFGEASRGHIALQDHGNRVAYRNIRIRPLD